MKKNLKVAIMSFPFICNSIRNLNQTLFLRKLNNPRRLNLDLEDYYHKKRLSLREQEVLNHLIQGKSYKEIAIVLSISIETVKKHASNIYKKTKTHSKFELKYNILEFIG